MTTEFNQRYSHLPQEAQAEIAKLESQWAEEDKNTPEYVRVVRPDPVWSEPVGGYEFPRDWDAAIHVEQLWTKDDYGREYTEDALITKSGRKLAIDQGVERRLDGQISAASLRHEADHQDGTHPWCVPCELRVRLYRAGIEHPSEVSDWAVEKATGEARLEVEARCRGLLIRGQLPPLVERQEDEADPWKSLDDLLNQQEIIPLVRDVLPTNGLGYLTGRDGTYKTFLALDLALTIATCRETWHGRNVIPKTDGGVVFVAGEGSHSFGARIAAWLEGNADQLPYGVDAAREELAESLSVRSGSVNLFTGGKAYDDLLALVKDRQPDLLVIDTLQTNSTGAESNSASDMGQVTARLHALRVASGGTVLVLAHTGKSDQDARGSSSIEDDADFVLHAKKDGERVSLTVAKMKDGPSAFDIGFKVEPVAGSLVIRSSEPEPEWASENLANRIRGVLYAVRTGDEPTATGVLALVKEDGTGKTASKTRVYDALGELERSGVLVATKAGTKAKTYRLDLSHYPQEAK